MGAETVAVEPKKEEPKPVEPKKEDPKPVEPKEEPKPEPKKEEPLSPRLVALQKAERELAAKHEAFKKERAEVEGLKALRENAKRDPLSALRALGLSFDELSQAIVSTQSNPEIARLRAEMEDFRASQTKAAEEAKQQQEAARQAAITKWRDETTAQVSDPTKHELLNHFESAHVVAEVIENTYRTTGKELSVPDAVKVVEDYYAGKVKAWLAKHPEFIAPAPAKPASTPEGGKPVVTLSADLGVGSVSGPEATDEAAAVQRARAALDRVLAGRAKQ